MKTKLCMYNDCKCGDYEYAICCCDCPHADKCPEKCENANCGSCYWMVEREVKEK